jgi:hypothetical protein
VTAAANEEVEDGGSGKRVAVAAAGGRGARDDEKEEEEEEEKEREDTGSEEEEEAARARGVGENREMSPAALAGAGGEEKGPLGGMGGICGCVVVGHRMSCRQRRSCTPSKINDPTQTTHVSQGGEHVGRVQLLLRVPPRLGPGLVERRLAA